MFLSKQIKSFLEKWAKYPTRTREEVEKFIYGKVRLIQF
jgi:hypothetical protein